MTPSIYKLRKKKRLARGLEMTERQYLNGGVTVMIGAPDDLEPGQMGIDTRDFTAGWTPEQKRKLKDLEDA